MLTDIVSTAMILADLLDRQCILIHEWHVSLGLSNRVWWLDVGTRSCGRILQSIPQAVGPHVIPQGCACLGRVGEGKLTEKKKKKEKKKKIEKEGAEEV